jgi:hypothetical protein
MSGICKFSAQIHATKWRQQAFFHSPLVVLRVVRPFYEV